MKNTIIEHVANATGKSKKEVKEVFDAIIAELKAQMKTGERVNIKEFGTFTVKERPAGVVTHPQTREKIQVPARKVPHFKASPKLKDEMNQ